jgi:hypothetical protein
MVPPAAKGGGGGVIAFPDAILDQAESNLRSEVTWTIQHPEPTHGETTLKLRRLRDDLHVFARAFGDHGPRQTVEGARNGDKFCARDLRRVLNRWA